MTMKKNSIKEMPGRYVSPTVIVMPFETEGILCQSVDVDGDGKHDDYDFGGIWGDDDWN